MTTNTRPLGATEDPAEDAGVAAVTADVADARDAVGDAAVRTPNRRVLVVGASRGLGEAIVEEHVTRGAQVTGTVRGDGACRLREFAAQTAAAGRRDAVEVERVDVTVPEQIAALRARLAGRRFDLLFVVAGVSLEKWGTAGASIPTRDFRLIMETNVLGVMRAVEALHDLVEPRGTIAVMSSGQGSVSGNGGGGAEVYRASKAALNQLFRSFAARHRGEGRSLLLMAPGWVKTELGGPGARFEMGDSIPPLIDTVDAQHGVPGLRFLDRFGQEVGW